MSRIERLYSSTGYTTVKPLLSLTTPPKNSVTENNVLDRMSFSDLTEGTSEAGVIAGGVDIGGFREFWCSLLEASLFLL